MRGGGGGGGGVGVGVVAVAVAVLFLGGGEEALRVEKLDDGVGMVEKPLPELPPLDVCGFNPGRFGAGEG